MEDCVFCKILARKIPAAKLYEDELFIVIRDIAPRAQTHCLAIPKRHYGLLADMTAEDAEDLGEIFARIPVMVRNTLGLKNGYRLIINQGDDAGQTVSHLHIHVLGGQKMEFNPA